MTPLVSILIPAYNAERWIRQTLESAIAQDYPRKEIILVNDGSKDRTLEIARRFESSIVKVVDQPNAGGPAARNQALKCAQGDYIQWLDHDDLLAPDKLSVQLAEIDVGRDQRLLLSCPFGVFYYRPENALFQEGPLWRDLTPREYFAIKFSGNTYFQSSSWLVTRKLTEMAGPWWELRSPDDDGEYFSRVVAASERIRFVREARCYWRIGNYGSFSEARSEAALAALVRSIQRSIEHYRAVEDTPESRAACVKFIQDRMPYFYPESPANVERLRLIAKELGGTIQPPVLTWKYKPIKMLFGWPAAKRAMTIAPRLKVSVKRNWDKFMFDRTQKRSGKDV